MIRSSHRQPADHRRRRPTLCTIRTIRGTDVEGYRVYRGRVDNPSELELIAQFDYAGTSRRRQGHLHRLPRHPEPGARLRARAGRADRLRAHAAAAAAPRQLRTSGRWTSTWSGPSPRSSRATACCWRTGPPRSFQASSTPRSPTCNHGRVAQGVFYRAHQWRRAVPVHRPQRPQQPAVLLLGGGVRRELRGVRPSEPRVASGPPRRSPRWRWPTTPPAMPRSRLPPPGGTACSPARTSSDDRCDHGRVQRTDAAVQRR